MGIRRKGLTGIRNTIEQTSLMLFSGGILEL